MTERFGRSPLSSLFPIAASAAAIFLPAIALAASGHDPHHHVPGIWDLRWYWFNFIVYVGIMFFLLRGPAAGAWRARRARLIEAVQGAKRELEEASARFDEAQARSKRLDADRAELTRRLHTETEREARQVIADAEERVKRIASQSQEGIQHERKALEAKLRKELALVVTEKAREQLKKEVTPEHDRSLRKASVGGVKGLLH